MKPAVRNLVLLLCAGAAGWGAGEFLSRATWSREAAGVLLGRGQFLALVRGRAIHERDLSPGNDTRAETLLAAAALPPASDDERVSDEAVERAFDLLRQQFGDGEHFAEALKFSQLTESSLRVLLIDHLVAGRALEARVVSHMSVAEDECRRVYESERSQFELPPRFRARHIFVAAPAGSAPAITLAQGSVAQGLSIRLLAGEEFAELAAEASEDEATKRNGGDLDYFSTRRVPPEFVAKLEELTVGETSPPLPSHLGFHIVRLMEKLPARALSFDEVRAEIASGIANQKRATEVGALRGWVKKPERVREGAVPP